MANQYQIVIDGHIVKEMRCKNDDCRALIGYDNLILGVFIFVCPRCQYKSVFKVQYKNHAKKFIEQLREKVVEEGGEKI